ncbi:MAG: DcaP family trimeric outer membrane transporter [Nitrospinae bacterium]|nr:DcaP family trimeric outer membrane transporter [Nitrospinota bacterium]
MMGRYRKIRFVTVFVGFVMALALFAAPAAGGEIDDLKAQIKALMERLEALEAREKKMKADMMAAQEAARKKAVATGDFPGSWKMPGSNTSVSFSGYVKLDAIYDIDQDLGDSFFIYDWGGGASGILLDGDDSGQRKASLHARQTRLRFDSLTPTSAGQLKTRIETDFYGGGNALRMRHAYASLGPVLAGQTWSTIMDANTYADTVDFEGPVGVIAVRRPQVRYSQAMGKNLTMQVALEDPNAPTILTSSGTVSSKERLPNLLAALRLGTNWGAVNVSGLVGQVRYEEGAVEEDLAITALHLGANIGLGKDTRLWGTFNVGRGGLDKTMLGASAAAVLGADNELEALDSVGGFVGLTQNWSGSGFYYGWVENDFEESAKAAHPSLSQSLQSIHANVWWSPAPKMRVGFEYMHGWRETNGGDEGDAARLQLGLVYSF